jgi:phospholipase C
LTDTHDQDRRNFLRMAATASAVATLAAFPPTIRRALALPASTTTGTIMDVQHVVILMQENRSFDHYFGTLRGVRGFADRHPIPLASGKPVWYQSNGEQEIPPFHLNPQTSSALRFPGTPHRFGDAQAAWAQGRFGQWPKFKTPMSMGFFRRDDIPFQFALAEAFTICDAHHCSVATGTDPNRIMFWSGSNFDPKVRQRGENCTEADAEVNNLRCEVRGAMPSPGYTYHGSAFDWQTLPEILEDAGITWRIYQDPNDNWTGLMHGGLAFASFRNARPGSALYEKGMSHRSLEQFAQDVKSGTLPQVSWVLPTMLQSEHPSPSSPPQGAEFTSQVLQALTANPAVWSRTAFFLTFDENDGLFDHVAPPAPPSFNPDGTPAGRSTLDLRGHYFSDRERKHLHPDDNVSGTVRPWGLGPRVPLYVISPWSRGGWVNSQVFDHTSVGQFLEKRFRITVPAISPWNRAVCGDLTSAFDFVTPNEAPFPSLPWMTESAARVAANLKHPPPTTPVAPEALYQEPGMRRSRALPYELHVHGRTQAHRKTLELIFQNSGHVGAVFHVYDRLHLERIPRRYTVEAGKTLSDEWLPHSDQGRYDLWVCGPNGFIREFQGRLRTGPGATPEIKLRYNTRDLALEVIATNSGTEKAILTVQANAYRSDGPWSVHVPAGGHVIRQWSVAVSHCWYDFSVRSQDLEWRLAGRVEDGRPGFSDPAV